MAKVTDLLVLAVPVGLGIGYFTDCFGYCTGFKAMIDDFIGSILGDGGGNGNGTDPWATPCAAGQYKKPDGSCTAIPTCPSGQGWNQATGVCEPVQFAGTDCGTAATNPGYTCCACKVAAGRTKCPAGICCKECITACPSQCKGFTAAYGRASFYSDNSRIFRGSYGGSKPRTSITPVMMAKNRPQMRLNSVAGFGDNDRI